VFLRPWISAQVSLRFSTVRRRSDVGFRARFRSTEL
jgi:hypothetical protein